MISYQSLVRRTEVTDQALATPHAPVPVRLRRTVQLLPATRAPFLLPAPLGLLPATNQARRVPSRTLRPGHDTTLHRGHVLVAARTCVRAPEARLRWEHERLLGRRRGLWRRIVPTRARMVRRSGRGGSLWWGMCGWGLRALEGAWSLDGIRADDRPFRRCTLEQ